MQTLIFFPLLIHLVTSYKILCLMPIASKSHEHVFVPVIEELISKGHQVTCVWPRDYPYKIENSNLKIIALKQTELRETMTMQKVFELPSTNSLSFFYRFTDFTAKSCEIFFQNNEVQVLLKNGVQFDLVLVNGFMNDCSMAIAALVANYSAVLSPNCIMPWLKSSAPRPPSFVPNMMLKYTDEMSFFERLNNYFYYIAVRAINDFHLVPIYEKIVKNYVSNATPVSKAYDKTSIVLVNTDPVMITPRPTMPNIINIGCVHCKKAIEVPKEFEEFIETSGDDGFILFSLGTNAQSKNFPKIIKQQFLQSFAKLNQKVIWKYEKEMENLPRNIKITKWMPQQDILGHSKIRLFITHGGLLSLQQAVYNAVPVIGIPIFSDQRVNLARVEQLGIGLKLDYTNITANNLDYVINKVLRDKTYRDNMKKYSKILRSGIGEPAKKTVYWLEYVIKHSGARHLKSDGEQKLNVLQYYLLDLILIPIALFFLFVNAFQIFKVVLKFIFKSQNSLP